MIRSPGTDALQALSAMLELLRADEDAHLNGLNKTILMKLFNAESGSWHLAELLKARN